MTLGWVMTACVGEGSAGEVGVEERVLEEDGGSEAHGDEASVQRAGARKRPTSAARTQRVGERLRHLHVGGGSGRRPVGRHHSNARRLRRCRREARLARFGLKTAMGVEIRHREIRHRAVKA
jgi:hypothetical protein